AHAAQPLASLHLSVASRTSGSATLAARVGSPVGTRRAVVPRHFGHDPPRDSRVLVAAGSRCGRADAAAWCSAVACEFPSNGAHGIGTDSEIPRRTPSAL